MHYLGVFLLCLSITMLALLVWVFIGMTIVDWVGSNKLTLVGQFKKNLRYLGSLWSRLW